MIFKINFSVGDLVDACDTTSIWINSTITFRFETTNNYDEKCVEYMIGINYVCKIQLIECMMKMDQWRKIILDYDTMVGLNNTMKYLDR